jgi:hypothetical protein
MVFIRPDHEELARMIAVNQINSLDQKIIAFQKALSSNIEDQRDSLEVIPLPEPGSGDGRGLEFCAVHSGSDRHSTGSEPTVKAIDGILGIGEDQVGLLERSIIGFPVVKIIIHVKKRQQHKRATVAGSYPCC